MQPYEVDLLIEVLGFSTTKIKMTDKSFSRFSMDVLEVDILDQYIKYRNWKNFSGCHQRGAIEHFVLSNYQNAPDKVCLFFNKLLDYFEGMGCALNFDEKQFSLCCQYLSRPQKTKDSLEYVSDISFVNEHIERIKECLAKGDFDSVVTKCRCIVEETLIYAIEKKGEKAPDTGSLSDLCRDFKNLYNTAQIPNPNEVEKNINGIFGGINKIIDALGNMRNKNSDAHGVGSLRVQINKPYAVLMADVAIALCRYIESLSSIDM